MTSTSNQPQQHWSRSTPPARKDLVLPSGDTLFTSGTLGHYSAMLLDLQENESRKHIELNQTAAD